ncbi:MAG: hypothetical protein QM654_14750 [Dysgonamonadaceae bacterium]
MKNILLFMLGTALLISCSTIKPRGFTYTFEDTSTGLDTLINIDGYYLSNQYCDSTYVDAFMFYDNGLFITTGTWSDSINRIVRSFKDIKSERNFIWGTYRIINDTIKTQDIYTNGWLYGPFLNESVFVILPNKRVVQLSFMKTVGIVGKYGARDFIDCSDNPCVSPAKFYPLESKRDYHECPWLKKKWFYKKK